MNYEDMNIHDYYEKKQAEHEELVGSYALLLVVVLGLTVICAGYKLIVWWMT